MDVQTILGASMQAAVAFSGYTYPVDLPSVRPIEPTEMCMKAMPTRPIDGSCIVKGFYDGKGIVYIDVTTLQNIYNNSEVDKSILIHELVHYLQDKNGKYGKSCEQWLSNEDEAYTVQRKYLISKGNGYPAGRSYYAMHPHC